MDADAKNTLTLERIRRTLHVRTSLSWRTGPLAIERDCAPGLDTHGAKIRLRPCPRDRIPWEKDGLLAWIRPGNPPETHGAASGQCLGTQPVFLEPIRRPGATPASIKRPSRLWDGHQGLSTPFVPSANGVGTGPDGVDPWCELAHPDRQAPPCPSGGHQGVSSMKVSLTWPPLSAACAVQRPRPPFPPNTPLRPRLSRAPTSHPGWQERCLP